MKTALITGGSRGIGAACVRAFRQAGWQTAFFYRQSREAAEALARETGAIAVPCDVADSEAVRRAVQEAKAFLPHVDALVNNAGIASQELLTDVTDEQWRRAYAEINQFERSLTDWGAIVIKFWLQIDSDEQLARFTDRQNTPEKQWKITDEDWRNRDKWPQYETAVNEMLWLTNTKHAPWVIVESNDKRYARLKVLRTVIEAIENRL